MEKITQSNPGSKRIFHILALFTIVLILPALSTLSYAKSPEFNKAVKLYNKGQFEKAIPILEKYIQTNPEPDAYYVLSYSYYKTAQHDKARAYFKILYEQSPNYSPTPELERKLNRKVKDARPGPDDEKLSVPKGELPPEARDLDPTKYKVIDESQRLVIPTTPSTNTFKEPAGSRKKQATRAKTTVAPVKKSPVKKPSTEKAPVAQEPKEVVAVVDEPPAVAPDTAGPETIARDLAPPEPVDRTEEINRKRQELQKKRTEAQKKTEPVAAPTEWIPEQILEWIPDNISDLLAGSMLFVVLGIFFGVYILACLPIFIIAKKLKASSPILAFVPIVNTWLVIKMADLSVLWFILTLLLGFPIFYAIIKISEKLGKSGILGLLLTLFLGPLGLLILAIIGSGGGGGGGAAAMASGAGGGDIDVSGEPDLDLPDMDDMGFDDMEEDFASDTGFGSDEGVGAHSDDFGVDDAGAGADDLDMNASDDSGGDSFELDDFDSDGGSEGGSDDFGVDFDDKSF